MKSTIVLIKGGMSDSIIRFDRILHESVLVYVFEISDEECPIYSNWLDFSL